MPFVFLTTQLMKEPKIWIVIMEWIVNPALVPLISNNATLGKFSQNFSTFISNATISSTVLKTIE